MAAITGYYFPIRHIWHQKSLGGCIANFATCLFIGIHFFPLFIAILGALTATLAELFSPLDDALSIPLISATMLYLLA